MCILPAIKNPLKYRKSLYIWLVLIFLTAEYQATGIARIAGVMRRDISEDGEFRSSSESAPIFNIAINLERSSSIGTPTYISLGEGITGGQDLTKVSLAILNIGCRKGELGRLSIVADTLISTSSIKYIDGFFQNNSLFTHKCGKLQMNIPFTKNIGGNVSASFDYLDSDVLTSSVLTNLSDFTGIPFTPPSVTISANPATTICQNASLTITANPAGDPNFTYLWSPGGATSQSINPSTTTPGSTEYYVIVTDGNGFTATTSVAVIVNALPVITTQSTDALDCEERVVSFNIVSNGAVTYVWQRKKPSGSFAEIPLVGEPNVSYPALGTIRLQNAGNTDAPDGTQYRAIITNDKNCSIISKPATLTVNEIIGITPGSTNVTICEGGNSSYLVTTSYPTNVVSYQWKKWDSPGLWINVNDGGAISGVTTDHLVFTGATPYESGRYKVTIVFHSSGADCNVTSDTRNRELIVNPLATVKPGNPIIICQTATPVAIILTDASVGGSATTGAWSITNLTPGNGGVIGTLSTAAQLTSPGSVTYTPPNNYAGIITLTLTTNDPAGPCGQESTSRTITIHPLPSVSTIYHE